MQNVVVTFFDVESEAYQAIIELKNDPGTAYSFVSEAALVRKTGKDFKVVEFFDSGKHSTDDTYKGTLIGMCLGVIGGPFGMLLGAGLGSLAGSTLDAAEMNFGASMLEQMVSKMDENAIAIIALADEESEAALNARLSRFKSTIVRFDAAVIAQEVEEAQKMEKEMERQAKAALRKEKNEEYKEKVETHRNKLKVQFDVLRDSLYPEK